MNKDPDFLALLFSLVATESGFNRDAVSDSGAYGLTQMTEAAVQEASVVCHLRQVHATDLRGNSYLGIRYGSCFLEAKLRETGGDPERALILYNGGYKQLLRQDAGLPVVRETTEYVQKVLGLEALCLLH